jgi:hypothetical protein
MVKPRPSTQKRRLFSRSRLEMTGIQDRSGIRRFFAEVVERCPKVVKEFSE